MNFSQYVENNVDYNHTYPNNCEQWLLICYARYDAAAVGVPTARCIVVSPFRLVVQESC